MGGYLNNPDGTYHMVTEIEAHLHHLEHWFGKKDSPTTTDWADEDTLTAYRAISGSGTWGADSSDEAEVIGVDNMPTLSGYTKYTICRIFIITLDKDTPYIGRFVYGSGTMDAAVSSHQYSNFVVQNIVTGSKAGGLPLDVSMPELTAGETKVWVQIMTAVNDGYMDFFVGVHEIPS